MKKLFSLFVLSVVCIPAFSQTNKPATGDWGLHYYVGFNGSFTQGFEFSRLLKNNLEGGAGLNFSVNSITNSQTESTHVSGNSGTLNAQISTTNKQIPYVIYSRGYLLYHFPVKSNLDLYAGGEIASGFNGQANNVSITESSATNFLEKKTQRSYLPLAYGFGASGRLGCRFFFYKNLSLGMQGSLGFNSTITNGKQGSTFTVTESGSDNPLQGTTITESTRHINSATIGAALSGSVVLNLSFYFTRTPKIKEATRQ
jgi:hypothetical protein